MAHALVTVIAPLELAKLARAVQSIQRLGNPAFDEVVSALSKRDDDAGIHFASLHAFASHDGKSAYILLELSADGSNQTLALRWLCNAIGPKLVSVFELADDWAPATEIHTYLDHHREETGNGLFGNPGIGFVGTPDITVGRILHEAALAKACIALLGAQGAGLGALDRLEAIRQALKADPVFASALRPVPPSPQPFVPQALPSLILALVVRFAWLYLWPLAIPVVAWALYCGGRAVSAASTAKVGAFLGAAVPAFFWALLVAGIVTVIAAALTYLRFRKQESADQPDDTRPERVLLAEMTTAENKTPQNHMISITRRKPGIIRTFTSRLAFWIVGEFAQRLYQPGFLSDIGTIHFARWITVPGNRDVVFLSNYDGSWESYLEDFITRAHQGLTAVWSNTVGFPRAENLFQKGATDGERFKRFARHSMIPTSFWYSAYPTLATGNIRTNAEIRRGLSNAKSEDEATAWIALFGSSSRPESKLISNEIQSLIFGGLKFLPEATAIACDLPSVVADARQWLAAIAPLIAFNDGRRLAHDAVLTLGVAANGLARLGLPVEGLETFPAVYLDGMAARARILGDKGSSDPVNWQWGRQPNDVLVLLYGKDAASVSALEATLTTINARFGVTMQRRVPLKPVSANKTEPFGFVDGVSQPVVRGTYKALRNPDSIHLVEAGEFILGYPDNRGNLPPGPTLPAIKDPKKHLPLVDKALLSSRSEVNCPRDLGANGSFLVVRELEQDVAAFNAYCTVEATRLAARLSPPNFVSPAFIGAKLVGRWQDGSSLVRHPYQPQTGDPLSNETVRLGSTAPDQNVASAGTVPATPTAIALPPPRPAGRKDNDFLFGAEDPEALRCPFGAHIRRANPRESLDPGSAEQVSITNRHRILRVGRLYEPAPGHNPGLLFMCLNGDLERQFEFIQQTWLNGQSFHGLNCEADPLVGDSDGTCAFTIPSREGPVRLKALPDFVTTRGGGYFFLPGKRLIDFLTELV